MGHAQSLTRTSGALDSFVAELGGDVVYERRYVVCVLPSVWCHLSTTIALVLLGF